MASEDPGAEESRIDPVEANRSPERPIQEAFAPVSAYIREKFSQTDILGPELRASLIRSAELSRELSASLQKSASPATPSEHPHTPQEDGSLRLLSQLVQLTAEVSKSTGLLAVRAEEQHQTKQQQNSLTWVLSFAVLFGLVNSIYDDHNIWTTITSAGGDARHLRCDASGHLETEAS